jgi:hypothetical protein
MSDTQGTWFLSAPEIAVSRRRGDPLGLRNITDDIAELLAPGLTNRTRDARWLTLLAWSLVESEQAWRKAGGTSVKTANERRERYIWLRPLELLWVARSIHLGGERYRATQWPGYRSIRRWDGKSHRFAMTDSQLNSYRQLGAYGAYRVLFRQGGFTELDDGWTPGPAARELAAFVNRMLKRDGAAPAWLHKPRLANPAQWWLATGWQNWQVAGRTSSLLLSASTPTRLQQEEIDVLAPQLFPRTSIRLRTAKAIQANRNAKDYVALCRALSNALPRTGGAVELSHLGDLAALHQAGIMLLRTVADGVADNVRSFTALARHPDVDAALQAFSSCATAWLDTAGKTGLLEHHAEADRLARIAGTTGTALLRRFIAHHEQHGSGARWFGRDGDSVILIGAESGIASGNFGYRLHALAWLAVQCGIVTALPKALTDQVNEDDA